MAGKFNRFPRSRKPGLPMMLLSSALLGAVIGVFVGGPVGALVGMGLGIAAVFLVPLFPAALAWVMASLVNCFRSSEPKEANGEKKIPGSTYSSIPSLERVPDSSSDEEPVESPGGSPAGPFFPMSGKKSEYIDPQLVSTTALELA